MADSVQELMEAMVPELKELVEHKVLSQAEVRALVKKRTDFEYRLRRRAVDIRDFRQYVEYETALDGLLRKRKARIGVKRGKAAKFSCSRQIHFIFDRAVKKFKANTELWMEWVAFAKQDGSSKILSSIFARALQLHPRKSGLWVHAASWEWEEQGNVAAARTLLQRALRLNPESEELWREYFRMEVLFVTRLTERRKVLGLAPACDAQTVSSIEVPPLDAEATSEIRGKSHDSDTRLSSGVDDGLGELLGGAIPLVVLRHAAAALSQPAAFLLSLFPIASLVTAPSVQRELEDAILTIAEDMQPGIPGAAVLRAGRVMAEARGKGPMQACEAAETVLREAATRQTDAAGLMWETRCRFWERVSKEAKVGSCEAGAEKHKNENVRDSSALAKEAERRLLMTAAAAAAAGASTEQTVLMHYFCLAGGYSEQESGHAVGATGHKRRRGKERDEGSKTSTVEAYEVLRAGAEAHPTGATLQKEWLKAEGSRVLADTILSAGDKARKVSMVLDQALAGCGTSAGAAPLWLDRLQMEKGRSGSADRMAAVLARMVQAGAEEAAVSEAVDRIAEIAEAAGGAGTADACTTALKRPFPSMVRGLLLRKIISATVAAGCQEEAEMAFERWAGEKCAQHDPSGWIEWEGVLRSKRCHSKASAVIWRAKRTLVNPSSLDEALALRDAFCPSGEHAPHSKGGDDAV